MLPVLVWLASGETEMAATAQATRRPSPSRPSDGIRVFMRPPPRRGRGRNPAFIECPSTPRLTLCQEPWAWATFPPHSFGPSPMISSHPAPLALVAAVLVVPACAPAAGHGGGGATPRRPPTAAVDRRIDSLLSAMTLDEKLGQLNLLSVEGDTVTAEQAELIRDRKSTRLNSSHVRISYAVFCL